METTRSNYHISQPRNGVQIGVIAALTANDKAIATDGLQQELCGIGLARPDPANQDNPDP